MFRIIILLFTLQLLFPSITYAQCPCNNIAPPQLDEQQANRWVNTLPTARPYLARMWEIDQRVAEYYGAEYKTPLCGGQFQNVSGFNAGDSATNPYIQPPRNEIGDRWNVNFKTIKEFTPIKIEYPQPDNDILTTIIHYDFPPGLDSVQSIRWGQALPSARVYLARLWDISVVEAIKYGAKY